MWNPLTWIKLLSLVKSLYDLVAAGVKWVSAWITKRKQQADVDKIHEAEQQISDANKIADDEQRLKEKADAACKLEQAFDPDRKC